MYLYEGGKRWIRHSNRIKSAVCSIAVYLHQIIHSQKICSNCDRKSSKNYNTKYCKLRFFATLRIEYHQQYKLLHKIQVLLW